MGEAKQRARTANDARLIEASEQERAALGVFLNPFAPENRHDRQICESLHEDFKLDTARDSFIAKLKERGDAAVADYCSAELVEFATTKQVLDYFLKIVDTKIQRSLGKHILTLEQRAIRLDGGSYTPPSQRTVEITADAPEPAV